MTWPLRSLLFLLPLVGACGPIRTSATLPNPARTTDKIAATQIYEVGPYKADHRYEAKLVSWTPSSVGFEIDLVNVGVCGEPQSYTFTLVDDQGHEFPWQPAGAPVLEERRGHAGAVLRAARWRGAFGAPIGRETRFVVLRIRPAADRTCSALDFRWDLE